MNGRTLEGRRALVTGGGAGIGAEIVRDLGSRGAHVVVADRDADAAGALAAEVGGTSWVVDLADRAMLDGAELSEQLGDVDILVNNAGIQRISAIEDFDPEAF
ncbi:MAG: SDR family NAD(P)-dependent oxidoreductase, partial [Actinobacteria bacterium]|nr:SDR family NAD(P)-dependent oxidoreductase [Actinomycetota bacterium]